MNKLHFQIIDRNVPNTQKEHLGLVDLDGPRIQKFGQGNIGVDIGLGLVTETFH